MPSKRARKIPEKKDLFKSPDNNLEDDKSKTEEEEISLDEVKEQEESIEKKTESLDSDQTPDNN